MGWSEDYRAGYDKQNNPLRDSNVDRAANRDAFIAGQNAAWLETQKRNNATTSFFQNPSSSNTSFPPSSTVSGGTGALGMVLLIVLGLIGWGVFGSGSEDSKVETHENTSVSNSQNYPTGIIEIPIGAPRSLTLDEPTGHLAVTANGRELPLYGIEALVPDGTDYWVSASSQKLGNFIRSRRSSVQCQPANANSYICFLVDETHRRKNVAKFALNIGAARALPDAPDSYRDLADAARSKDMGNWR